MRQNKKKRDHRKTNNAKCVESFIWFWRDFPFFLLSSFFYIFFPVNRMWHRTKGFCCRMWKVPMRTANNMYLSVSVCVISACGKCWADANVKRGLVSFSLALPSSFSAECLILLAVHLLNYLKKKYIYIKVYSIFIQNGFKTPSGKRIKMSRMKWKVLIRIKNVNHQRVDGVTVIRIA